MIKFVLQSPTCTQHGPLKCTQHTKASLSLSYTPSHTLLMHKCKQSSSLQKEPTFSCSKSASFCQDILSWWSNVSQSPSHHWVRETICCVWVCVSVCLPVILFVPDCVGLFPTRTKGLQSNPRPSPHTSPISLSNTQHTHNTPLKPQSAPCHPPRPAPRRTPPHPTFMPCTLDYHTVSHHFLSLKQTCKLPQKKNE